MTPEEILQVEKDIVATLKNIYDPEIPVNIYDLGLIYEIALVPDGLTALLHELTISFQPGKISFELPVVSLSAPKRHL